MLIENAHWTRGQAEVRRYTFYIRGPFAPFGTLTKRLADRIKDKKKVARSPDLA